MGIYTSHTKLAQTCIWGSVAGCATLLYILQFIYDRRWIEYDFAYYAVVSYFATALMLMLFAIFSRVDALYLSFLRGGRRLSRDQLTFVLSSIYLGSLLLFWIAFYFVVPDLREHVRQFLDYGSIRRLLGAYCIIPLVLSLVALLVSNVLAIGRGTRISKRDERISKIVR